MAAQLEKHLLFVFARNHSGHNPVEMNVTARSFELNHAYFSDQSIRAASGHFKRRMLYETCRIYHGASPHFVLDSGGRFQVLSAPDIEEIAALFFERFPGKAFANQLRHVSLADRRFLLPLARLREHILDARCGDMTGPRVVPSL